MRHGRRTAAVIGAALCLIVGGALGGGLLDAGATTSGKSPAAGTRHGSNEDPAHEAGESAAREAAEDNGTATFGDRDGDHHGERGDADGDRSGPVGAGSNEDPAHEAAESKEREAEESGAGAAPSSATPANGGT